jgi:hypothetical protein
MSWESLQTMVDRWPELDEIQREGLLGSFRVLVASLIDYWPALTAEQKVAAIEGWLRQVEMKEAAISELSRLLSTDSPPPPNVAQMTRREMQLRGLMVDGDKPPYSVAGSPPNSESEGVPPSSDNNSNPPIS